MRWRAFELRPEPVELLDPQGAYLTSAWNNHVYPLAKKLGVEMKMPPLQPRSRLAHEAAKWAETKGCLEEFNRAVFQAFFVAGADIGKVEVLLQLAADLGLATTSLQAALENHEFLAPISADAEAAIALGVRAVPAFVSAGQVLAAGVQSSARLRELLEVGPGGALSFL